MSDQPTATPNPSPAPTPNPPKARGTFVIALIASMLATAAIAALLVSIFTRKQEGQRAFVIVQPVDENTTDPVMWGKNWPRQFDSYKRTAEVSFTDFGGANVKRDTVAKTAGSEAMPEEKIERDPWLKRMFAGYAFAIDYRDRRGHAYMLSDQEATERVGQKPQPGACLHCHASVAPTWRRVGLESRGKTLADVGVHDFSWPDVMKGFELVGKMSYAQAHGELLKTPDGSPGETKPMPGSSSVTDQTPAKISGTGPTTREVIASHKKMGEAHPVSCVDCHDPRTMELRITRPGFMTGIKALKAKEGKKDYDPNRDATRQEMRTYVCAQCHVEYYCGPKVTLFFPWGNGLKVEEIEEHYNNFKFPDGKRFFDWEHGETKAELLKAQHPEFELYSQGTHAKAGVACADCHMPYTREGAMKVSDHWVRSPLLNINRACQTCHPYPESELKARADTIQQRNHALLQRSGKAMVDMLDAIKAARQAGVSMEQLKPVLELQRKATWRLDFIAAENSMGFHAPQEAARVLAESIDYARQGQAQAQAMHLAIPKTPTTIPATQPVRGVTPAEKKP